MNVLGIVGGAALVGAVALGSFAGDAEARGERAATSAAAGSDRAEQVRGSKAEADAYVAELVVSEAKAGAKATYKVTLKPKGGFHINAQFPMRFKADTTDDVTYTKPILKREDGEFTEAEGSFTVEFVASKTGKHAVGGTLSLSVCNDANCLMEKVALTGDVDVK